MSAGRRRRERRLERAARLSDLRALAGRITPGDLAVRSWQQARARWLDDDSPLYELWLDGRSTAWAAPAFADQAVAFLEADPMFPGSGYLKETLLRRLGQVPLDADAVARLREVLADAVRRRGGREFRRYCGLAARLADGGFVERLRPALASPDPATRSRARMMAGWIARHGASADARRAARERERAGSGGEAPSGCGRSPLEACSPDPST